jgi:hypothetical protein
MDGQAPQPLIQNTKNRTLDVFLICRESAQEKTSWLTRLTSSFAHDSHVTTERQEGDVAVTLAWGGANIAAKEIRPNPGLVLKAIASVPWGERTLLRFYKRVYNRFFPRSRATTVFGASFDCEAHDLIQASILHFGLWEPHMTALMKHLIEPDTVIVDIGANIGYYSLMFSQLAGHDGKVIAIEALPRLAEYVRENSARNGATNIDVRSAPWPAK